MPGLPKNVADSRALFPRTAWTLIGNAKDLPESQGREQLETLLRQYWKPIYAYFRSKGVSRHDAEELVQSFLYDFVRDEKIRQVDQQLGKFRTWLRKCLDNYLISWQRKRGAKKRRPDDGVLSFEQLATADGQPFEPAGSGNPETALVDAWRRDLLGKAFKSVAEQCQAAGNLLHYSVFVAYYCDASNEKITWQQIADQFELPSWKDAARKADWVKAQLGREIRRQVASYSETDEEIDEELQELY
jgi:RNA polymerase sigma factor (sigma-70 family)